MAGDIASGGHVLSTNMTNCLISADSMALNQTVTWYVNKYGGLSDDARRCGAV